MNDFQNPQQDPGTEKRLLIAVVLTILIIVAAQSYLGKYVKSSSPAPAAQQQQQQPQAATSAPAATPAPSTPAAPASNANRAIPAKQASSESETVVENELYRITFTNRGAQVKSWILKKYNDDKGHPLDLVNPVAAPKYGYPMSLWTYDSGLRDKLSSALYVESCDGQSGPNCAPKAGEKLSFEYSDGDTVVRKTFGFDDSYVVKIETSVTQKGSAIQAFPAWPSGFGDETVAASYAAARIEWQNGDKTERLATKKVSGGATQNGPFQWAAAVDQYFVAAFMPDNPDAARLVMLHNAIDIPKNLDKPDPKESVSVPVLGAAAGDVSGVTRERVFVGPKSLEVLESVYAAPSKASPERHDLRELVNFGFFGIIARPLFLWLRWTQEHWASNWGWSIIILTIIINLALLPLRITSMRSALKMQKVQPRINAIKKKYEKYSMRDPRKAEMNQEMAALFKEEGVNPAGGCIPLLIQMPFLFAFYTMLGNAIELRQAQWFWLHDLSSPDPHYILPIGIILSTLWVQKMTPQAGVDPAQQKMMTLMMPVMLGIISWNLASGLCLYWVMGNVIMVIQQMVMNRTSLGREMREEMEKRARKKKDKD